MGNRLLLADDSITIQKVVGIIFANEEYELTIVDNGTAALVKAAETKPDIMLVDAIMPGKTGYEVCEAIRRDPQLKNTPILLMTGAFEPFDENQARSSGADDFISKPFESQHLIEKVKNLITLGKNRPQAAAAATAAPAAEEFGADLWEEATPAETAFAFEPAASPDQKDLCEGFSFAEEPADDELFATELVSPEEVETTSSDDDLWGAFEIEELPEGDDADVVAIVEPVEEEAFALEEPAREPVHSFADLNEPVTVAAPSFVPPEPLFAPDEGFEPVAQPVVAAAPPPPAGTMMISEEQLASLVAKISRDIIERIAWEVVPDLAETLIKEEIRKIKEGS